MALKRHILTSADAAAARTAALIATLLNKALQEKPVATIAFSGGSTPKRMFQYLTQQDIAWSRIEIFQVDERFAPAGDSARNLTALQHKLLDHIDIPPQQVHAMPVEAADREAAIKSYTSRLTSSSGNPPRLDIVHLGLGNDGHTASLVPGDAVLRSSRPVDICVSYNGYQRMTLTYPVLNEAAAIIWLVTGVDKKAMLKRLLAKDSGIPAGKVNQRNAILIADGAIK